LVEKQGYKISEAARALGIHRKLLDRWVAKAREKRRPSSPKSRAEVSVHRCGEGQLQGGGFVSGDVGQSQRILRVASALTPDQERARRVGLAQAIPEQKRGSYGSRRMARELRRRGEPVGRSQVRSLMREPGVEARQWRRGRNTTDSDHEYPVAPDRLQRRFPVSEPDRFWVADITGSTAQDKLAVRLSPVLSDHTTGFVQDQVRRSESLKVCIAQTQR